MAAENTVNSQERCTEGRCYHWLEESLENPIEKSSGNTAPLRARVVVVAYSSDVTIVTNGCYQYLT